jgi:phosphatidylglycerol lysyltransferase
MRLTESARTASGNNVIRSQSWTVPEECACFSSRDTLGPERLRIAESLAYRYGEAYDSYLLVDGGRQYFFGRQNEGVLGFTTWGNHAYVVGGLLTAPHRKGQLLQDFMEFAQANLLEVSFLNILKSDVPIFRAAGYQVSKVGEEPVVDLRSTTWHGGDYAWVRRQENFCWRNGLRFESVEPQREIARFRSEIAPELLDVSHEHLRHTVYGRELALVVSRLDVDNMFRKRVFMARRCGRMEAFVVCTPSFDGRMWSVETYRRRQDATRGVIAFLIMQVARRMQEEEVRFLSLCQVPGLRVHLGTPSDSRFVVNGLRFWWKRLPWFYDTPRQYHFKSRFRPQYRECFVATYPRTKILPMLAFFFKWGIIRPDFTRLPMQMVRRMRKWANSEVLADADAEDYSLIEDLGVLIEAPTESSLHTVNPLSDPMLPVSVSPPVAVAEPV